MDIEFVSTAPRPVGACVFLVGEEEAQEGTMPTPLLSELALPDVAMAQLVRASHASGFKGKSGEVVTVASPAGLDVDYLMVLGVGESAKLTPDTAVGLGGKLAVRLADLKVRSVVLHVPSHVSGLKVATVSEDAVAACLAHGLELRSYRFDLYKTERAQNGDDAPPVMLESLTIVSSAPEQAVALHQDLTAVREGVFLARDLANEPANMLYPESFADRLMALGTDGLEVEVLDEGQLQGLGMEALLAVGQGSVRASRVVVMRWQGDAEPGAAPVAFVGKGVTFDTGGISIKPAAGMEDMKFDMAGAAAVAGAMRALARRKARVNAVGVVGLVENMPSGNAVRPGDVVRSMAGKTIEVINTDAEGRLVLADILHYTKDRFKPTVMINLATLTGAILVTLGDVYAGLFSNDDDLSTALMAAGGGSGEKLWRLPLDDAYAKQLKSDIADLKNLGTAKGQSITAAEFLKHFVGDTPWAHLDICGMAWAKEPTALAPKGGTGFGVRLLDAWVRTREAA